MAGAARTITMVLDTRGRPKGREIPVVRYRVTAGPDRRTEHEQVTDRLVIGTAPGTGLTLTDPTVSALHCELFFDAQGLRVRDLDSKNGVLVDGVRAFDARVPSGATLTLGRTTVKVKLPGASVESLLDGEGLEGLVGSALAMRVLYGQVRKAARVDANVLISGAIGTGKELVAEALVGLSTRAKGPISVVDCRAIAEGLAESELFGHEAGAYTGASKQRAGVFERSHTGTLILDEVAELSPATQARLLGVLQRGSFRRVGGDDDVKVDVRVISLTARELPRLVNQQLFRADLYYRLAGIELRVPSLAERREDLPALVAHFLEQAKLKTPLSAATLQHLCNREYRGGNVRELANAVERAVAGLEGGAGVEPLAPGEVSLDVPYATARKRLIDGFERAYVVKLLAACDGNVSLAARRGGVNRVHLHELINRLGLKGHV